MKLTNREQEFLNIIDQKKSLSRQKYLFTAFSLIAMLSVIFLVWAQAQVPNPGHAANQIGAGTFAAGDYILQGNLNISKNITVNHVKSNGTITAANITSTGSVCIGGDCRTSWATAGTANTSCFQLATLSSASNTNTIIDRPYCFGELGGCSMLVVLNVSTTPGMGVGRLVNPSTIGLWYLFQSDSSYGGNILKGKYGNSVQETMGFASVGASGNCTMKDDGNNDQTKLNFTLLTTGNKVNCEAFICP